MIPIRPSRREFLASTLMTGAAIEADALFSALALAQPAAKNSESQPSSVISVDLRRLVSAADLDYTEPPPRSEGGIPIGNGSMGTLVWTEPTAIKMQINRVDVFAEDRSTNSFPERNKDYGSSCGYVDLDFGDFGDDVFSGAAFHQHLHVYDGISDVAGNGVSARAMACEGHNAIAVEVDDGRAQAGAVKIDLRMLRHAVEYLSGENYELTQQHAVKAMNRGHAATSTLAIRKGCILLVQKFEEGGYYNASAVAIQVVGRKSKAKYANDATVRLGVAPGAGKWTALIASASSFDRNEDVGAKALAELDGAAAQSFDSLAAANRTWWNDFWSRAFVRLDGPDAAPKEIEKHYTYYLYVMAATSRGSYMPRFGGMLWFTNGDMREWGAQYWWANQSCYYNALSPANRPELLEPMIATYSGMRESSAQAARQQWGSKGIYIPETCWFNGLETLPDEMAAEMRDLYLLKKPWEQRSTAFQYMAEVKLAHTSRWNWKAAGEWVDGHFLWKDRGCGPYGPVTHILSSGAKIAYLFWVHYEHTQDGEFLREHAYPLLRGIAEFYRNYPNLERGADGKYHILHVNNHEPVYGACDTQEELSAMMGIFPIAARAAEILGADEDLRAQWREVRANLAPLPTNASPGAPKPQAAGEAEIWIAGLPPVVRGDLGAPHVIPALHYDLCSVETADAHMLDLGRNTFQAIHAKGIDSSTVVTVLSTDSAAAANLGRGEDMRFLLMNQIANSDPSRGFCDARGSGPPWIQANRMTLREGPGAIGIERLGRMAEGLHAALLQSNPARPGGEPIVHVFPAWPRDWEAQFTLSARGGFVVTSSFAKGAVEFVEVRARGAGNCTARNPWKTEVAVFRDGRPAGSLAGELLRFPIGKDETVVIAQAGKTPADLKREI